MQWLQDPNQRNADNLNNLRREASGYFRNKKKEYLKPKIGELETNSKAKNIRDLYRGINDFKKGYQPRTNIVKDSNSNPSRGIQIRLVVFKSVSWYSNPSRGVQIRLRGI